MSRRFEGDRSGTRRCADDSGSVIAEFAIVLPFLMLMIFGLTEYGFALGRKTTTESVASSANRMTAQLGKDRTADAEALRAVNAGLDGMEGAVVRRVVVWKANAQNGPRCVTGGSVAGLCNVYTAANVAASVTWSPTGTTCGSSIDSSWCPTSRVDTDLTQDWVGVYVEIEYDSVTKAFGNKTTMSAWSIMRIEPPLGTD